MEVSIIVNLAAMPGPCLVDISHLDVSYPSVITHWAPPPAHVGSGPVLAGAGANRTYHTGGRREAMTWRCLAPSRASPHMHCDPGV